MVRARNGFPHAYTPDATVQAENDVRSAFCKAQPGPYPTFDRGIPLAVTITCRRALPKSRPKSVESEPDVFKPDGDNVAKLVLDALNGFAWQDDSQVVEMRVTKEPRRRGAQTATEVTIWEVDG